LPIPAEQAENVFLSARRALQMVGMAQSHQGKDDPVWDITTEMLQALRTVLMATYKVELPEARVVSMVTEMVEAGLLKAEDGPDDTVLISLPE
jgi:hypothetical protein